MNRTNRHKRPPRGVVLLVVLSLLVLFMVLTVTFVVVTGHYKRTSLSYARLGRTSSQNTAGGLADNVVYQLLRGTHTSSALKGQSLLEDLYGNDGFLGFVIDSQLQGGGQLMELSAQIDPRNGAYSQIDLLVRNGVMPDGCFNGRVLTIIDSVWSAGPDERWGRATANDDGFGTIDHVREAGFPNSDDRTMSGRMWSKGNDLQWGRAGNDDDGSGTQDDFSEAGFAGSDDILIPFTDPGPDGGWGVFNVDDDGDGVRDNSREANWPGSDDRRVSPVASTRVVKSIWQRNPNPPGQIIGVTLLVEAFPDLPVHHQNIPTLAQRFVINGAPFNGTGIGYHPGTQGLDLNIPVSPGVDGQWGVAGTDDDNDGSIDEQDEAGFPGSDDLAFPVGLAQNFSNYRSSFYLGSTRLSNYVTPDFAVGSSGIVNATAGGQDESYDAADYQNMFLSATIPTTLSPAGIIPSLHRPELTNYLFNWAVSNLFWDPSGSWWVDPVNHWRMFMTPLGPDGKPGTGDEPPANPGFPVNYRQYCRDLKRWCIFRPLPDEHPNFISPSDQLTWSGTDVANSRLINGPYDVDNDGDGIADSVWIDVGLPPVRLPDGRLVKPMVAIQVEDLDNRFDLNAHTGLDNYVVQLPSNAYDFHPGRDGRWGWAGVDDDGINGVDDIGEKGRPHPMSGLPSDDVRIAGTGLVAGLPPRGLGVGPAEISLRTLFVDPDNNGSTINASYPADLLSVISDRYRRLGSAAIVPGQIDGNDDELSLVKDFHLPIQYWNTGFARTSYSTASDSRGLGSILLDFNGQPLRAFMGVMGSNGEVVDDPYELGVGGDSYRGRTGGDNSYTVNDLERLLRWNDHDARLLSSRLADLAPDVFVHPSARRLVTTLSSHVPAPNLSVPAELRNLPIAAANYWRNRLGIGAQVPTTAPTVADLFFAKFLAGGIPPTMWSTQLSLMFPHELQKGQLFDVNRPFGNGRDDDGDGIVDDPYEQIEWALSGIAAGQVRRELAWFNPGLPSYQFSVSGASASAFPGRWFNGSNFRDVRVDNSAAPAQTYLDPLSDPNRYQGYPSVRQVFARHLYCLMMLLVDNNFQSATSPPTAQMMTAIERKQELARRVAQWAVNVVDFRDADSIMTPFEYDFDPFNANGWSVDGVIGQPRLPGPDSILGTSDDVWGTSDHANPERQLVWGCEAPDLLITETTAFHDRRVKDTDQDNGMAMNKSRGPNMTDDDDLDQFRKPTGSLFLELYCPREPRRAGPQFGNTASMPAELYNAFGNLDLARVAPVRPGGAPLPGIQHPVWRVAISPKNALADHARTAYTSPTPDTLNFTPDPANIERMIWFAPLQPTATHPEANVVFYGRTGNLTAPASLPALPPNHYAVIGPRDVTPIGSKDNDGDGNLATYDLALAHQDSTHLIRLAGGPVTVTDNRVPPDATYTYPASGTTIQPPVTVVCAADPPSGWALAATDRYSIGMNVSEPLPSQTYYPKPYNYDQILGPGTDKESYYIGPNSIPDLPFDEDTMNFPNSPLANPIDVRTGTRTNYRGIYLQRLADPTQPWNPLPNDPNYSPLIPCNPYITVDFASVDLTVFSGDEATNRLVSGVDIDPKDPNPFTSAPSERFRTRERGGDVGGGNPPNLFSPYTLDPATTAAAVNADPELYFRHRIEHTLGFLNTNFGARLQIGQTIGSSVVMPEAVGAPLLPFPWFTWFDRPFANPFELLVVPSSSPSRVLYEYVGNALTGNPTDPTRHPVIPNTAMTPYGGVAPSPNNWRAPYAHLMNFFNASLPGFPGADLSRVLDLLETQSPFVNGQRWYNPNVAESDATGWLNGFRPPYNRLSRFRDPGRININTIYDQRVWNGINDLFPNLGDPFPATTQWDKLQQSRQDYAGGVMNPSYPSRFNNPFRAALSSDLMPNAGYNLRDRTSGAVLAGPVNLRKPSSEATLLRTDPNSGPNFVPLFDNNLDIANVARNAPRNPYFRYQGLARLSNLVTNHSNVFAVRMTIGYFELEPWATPAGVVIRDEIHPDGLAIGHEVGSDTGNVKRERAFFIIDRSIPVGFEPDENHNVDKAILVRRYIN